MYKVFKKGYLVYILFFISSALQAQLLKDTVARFYHNELGKMTQSGNTLWIASLEGLIEKSTSSGAVTLYKTTPDGIPLTGIRAINTDHSGNIWMSICPSNSYRSILLKYDGTTWFHYDSIAINFNKPYQAFINAIEIDTAGKVLFQVRNGFIEFDGQAFTPIEVNISFGQQSISDICVDDSNSVWLSDNYDGYYEYKNGKFFHFQLIQGIQTEVDEIVFTSNKELFISLQTSSSISGGLYKINRVTHSSQAYNLFVPGQGFLQVTNLCSDALGFLWGNVQSKLFKFKNGLFSFYSLLDSVQLHDTYISSIYIDNFSYTIYTGLNNGYLVNFTTGTWGLSNLSSQQVPSNTLNSFVFDKNQHTWLSDIAAKEITEFDGTNFVQYKVPDSLNFNLGYNKKIRIDAQNNKWILTDNRLVQLSNANVWKDMQAIFSTNPFGSSFVYDFDLDAYGNIWTISDFGIIRKYSIASGLSELYTADSLFGKSCSGCNAAMRFAETDSAGNTWIGGYYGLLKYDGTNLLVYPKSQVGLSATNGTIGGMHKSANFGILFLTVDRVVNTLVYHVSQWLNNTLAPLLPLDNFISTYPTHPVFLTDKPNVILLKRDDEKIVNYTISTNVVQVLAQEKMPYFNSAACGNRIVSFEYDSWGQLFVGFQNAGFSVYKPGGVVLKSEAVRADENALLKVFPNPNSGIIYFENAQKFSGELTITASTGKIVFQQEYANGISNPINLEHQASGIYFIKATSSHGVQHQKIILK